MKNYISPEIEITILESSDILISSTGELQELPDGDEMPKVVFGTGLWNWN